jgi:hypothetical protein
MDFLETTAPAALRIILEAVMLAIASQLTPLVEIAIVLMAEITTLQAAVMDSAETTVTTDQLEDTPAHTDIERFHLSTSHKFRANHSCLNK